MKKLLSIAFIVLLLPAAVSAEYLFLSDGSIVEGKIITQKVMTVTVKKSDGKTVILNGFDILRIRQQKTWKEKIFVHAGKNLYIANLVEEKGDEYIFRRDIKKPEEFSLKKSSITILQGAAATKVRAEKKDGVIDVSWTAIPGAREYSVYLKPQGGDYRETGRTAQTSLSVTERLKGNTRYTCVVTAWPESGIETGPCPSSEFVSDNYPPSPPQNISCSLVQLAGGRSGASLVWDGDADEDGIIARYNIYRSDDGENTRIASSIKKNFIVQGINPDRIYSFAVSSVDDRGAESPCSRSVRSRDAVLYTYAIRGAGLYPLFSLGDSAVWGAGGFLSVVKNDMFIPGLDIGIESGFLYFKGKSASDKSDALPLAALSAYRYRIGSSFYAEGSVRAGMWYYSTLDMNGGARHNVKPGASAGLALIADVSRYVSFRVGAEYGAVYSKGKFLQYAGGSAGTSFKLEL